MTQTYAKKTWLPGLFVIVTLAVFPVPVEGQSDSEESDQMTEWRETLRYGIESEVVELLDELTENREEELADEVLELLEEKSSPRLLEAGLAYFAEIEDPRAEEVAVRLLEGSREIQEDTVIEALRYLGDSVTDAAEETVLAVRDVLNARSPRVVSRAALTLGSLRDVAGIPAMRGVFERQNEESVRGDIILGIGRMGVPARDAAAEWILPLISDSNLSNTVRYYAIDTVGRTGVTEAEDELKELLSHSDGMMRAYTISSLIQLEVDDIEDELTSSLRDDNWRVRQIALEGVASGGRSDSFEAVRYMARRDPDHRVRTTAVDTIGELGMSEGYSFLRELLSSQEVPFETRARAVDVLVEEDLGASFETFAEVIEEESGGSDNRLMHRIGSALSRVEHGGLAELYEAFLDHEDVSMRLFAIQGIGRNGLSEFRDEIEELADESQPSSVRRNAQEALEQL